MEQIITGLVKNQPGVLANIADKFRDMNININSLVVAATEDENLSCITIVTDVSEMTIEQIEKNLASVIEIKTLAHLVQGDHYERELLLIKISLEADQMSHLMQISELFRAHVVGVGEGSIVLEFVGETEQINGFIQMVKPFGIKGMARTGRTALKKE